ncbi:hypothetical protein [Arthrobacter sp. D1-17]
MSEIAKGVLGGAWTLLVGWIFPAFLVLESALILWLPAVAAEEPFSRFARQGLDQQQLVVLLVSVAVGFLLAALQTPLYKILEGYWLWPKPLKDSGTARQKRIRAKLIEEAQESGPDNEPNHWVEMRFSSIDNQLAPTAFGNAMRRFETYAVDRYYLDSQTLWHHLAASAPEYIVKAEASARTNVDFAVALTWLSSLLAAVAGATWIMQPNDSGLIVSFFLAAVAAYGAYRLAILGTDEWAATVRAQVDLGRVKLAESMGYKLPKSLHNERALWSHLNYFVKEPFDRSNVEDVLNKFRIADKKDESESQGHQRLIGGHSAGGP